MEETPNAVLNGLSPEARRNSVENATPTPRDKENAGANTSSTRHSQSATVDQPKASSSATNSSTTSASAPPPVKTPARSRLTNQTPHQRSSPSFFSSATTPSPASANTKSLPAFKDPTSSSKPTIQLTTPAPPSFPALSAQKSPPGTSQVLRKHFQSLGFATPPGKHAALHHQRLLSSGAVRLTPNSRKKAHKGNQSMASSRRIGYDGTKYTPSNELLKSTASSRNQRVPKDLAYLEDPTTLETQDGEDSQLQQHLNNQIQPTLEVMDDETSTVTSAATMDDASFDMSLPSMNQHSFLSSSNTAHVIPAPHSPLTPRMGCLNPVALTLLNDGKEDYNYLLTQDALYPIPKVEDTTDPVQPANTSMSSSSSTSSSCLSPTQSLGQSPAEVRATLSHTVRSTLARPVAIMPKTGRISPSHPRLMMRPQPKHVR